MDHNDLEVFKESHNLVLEVYGVIKNFPKDETFRIVSQLTKAAYSIPANIAEGNSRATTRDYLNFLHIARGSLSELQYYLMLSKDLKYIDEEEHKTFDDKCVSVAKLLNALISSLKRKCEAI